MTYLEQIDQRLTALSSEMEAKQAEFQALLTEKADLETAKRVLLTLPCEGNGEVVPRPGGHLVRHRLPDPGKPTILGMAKVILAERGEMYYAEIADEALRRGYVGKKGSSPARIQRSFWAIMKRNKDTFNATGKGRFTLTNGAKISAEQN